MPGGRRSRLTEAWSLDDSYEDYDYSSDEEFAPVDPESAAAANAFVEDKYRFFVSQTSGQLSAIERAISSAFTDLWSVDRAAISVDTEPVEQATYLELAKTENQVLNKIVATLAAVCDEVDALEVEAETYVYAPLALHGEALTGEDDEDDGEVQLAMGRLLPLLQQMCTFVRRCYGVARNLVHQLAALYSSEQTFFSVQHIHFRYAFEALGRLLRILITIEEIIKQNAAVKEGWVLYRRMVNNMRNDPERYETDDDELRLLNRTLQEVESCLLDEMIVQNALEQVYDYDDIVEVSTNAVFKAEFQHALQSLFADLSSKIGGASETNERQGFIGLCALYALYFTLYRDMGDGSFFKRLWDMYGVLPVLHVYGNFIWFPNEFLSLTVPEMMRFAGRTDVAASRRAYLQKIAEDLPRVAYRFYLQVSAWMVRMESNLSRRASIQTLLQSRIALFTQGVVLACNIGHMYKTAMGLHTAMRKPLTPSRVRALCQLIELLKAIEMTYYRRTALIAENIPTMVQQVTLALQRTFVPVKQQFETARRVDNTVLDALAGVNLALAMLDGPASRQRRILTRFGLAVAMQKGILGAEAYQEMATQLRRLDLLCTLQREIRSACDCSFLYWSRVMIPVYLKDAYERPMEIHKLPYMFAAIQDAARLLHKVEVFNDNVKLDAFLTEVDTYLEETLVRRLCRDVEVELRLQCHGELLVTSVNPYETRTRDYAPFFRLKPMVLFDKIYDLGERVTHYLNLTFYDLTSVTLQDWKVYEQMRTLAAKKYGLCLTDAHLQGHGQQRRLDVLVIMRNIAAFVQRYNYNMNEQVFVERVASSKALNSINIQHIAASIKTHGPGIMNTAVNYVFGFLKQRFEVFRDFLFDDHIRSPLMKDIHFFRKNHESLDNVYPYDRAETFNRDIRNLGTHEGTTYLDHFRVLVTEIGNALGYIRMIRSGGLHACSEEIKFVPNLQNMLAFQDLCLKDRLSDATAQSSLLLDEHLAAMVKNFGEGSDYFQILVEVFGTEFRTQENDFLNNFYIIIPPLTINYIEHMLESKERLIKKNKDGASFTDDGFAVGIAYILQVLDLTANFDSLHWFDSVHQRYRQQEQTVAKEAKSKRRKERETAALTLNRLGVFKQEFDLLNYTFTGAQIFFRAS